MTLFSEKQEPQVPMYIDIKKAALLSGISISTLRQLVKQGQISAIVLPLTGASRKKYLIHYEQFMQTLEKWRVSNSEKKNEAAETSPDPSQAWRRITAPLRHNKKEGK